MQYIANRIRILTNWKRMEQRLEILVLWWWGRHACSRPSIMHESALSRRMRVKVDINFVRASEVLESDLSFFKDFRFKLPGWFLIYAKVIQPHGLGEEEADLSPFRLGEPFFSVPLFDFDSKGDCERGDFRSVSSTFESCWLGKEGIVIGFEDCVFTTKALGEVVEDLEDMNKGVCGWFGLWFSCSSWVEE